MYTFIPLTRRTNRQSLGIFQKANLFRKSDRMGKKSILT